MTRIELNEFDVGIVVYAEGHAGYAPAGRDIVCAGISAILYGSLSFLRHQANEQGKPAQVKAGESPGRLAFGARDFADGIEHMAMKVIRAQLRALEEVYPDYVSVTYTDHRKNEEGGSEAV